MSGEQEFRADRRLDLSTEKFPRRPDGPHRGGACGYKRPEAEPCGQMRLDPRSLPQFRGVSWSRLRKGVCLSLSQLLGSWEPDTQPPSSCLLGFFQARSSRHGLSPSATWGQVGRNLPTDSPNQPMLPARQWHPPLPWLQEQRQVSHCPASAILHKMVPLCPGDPKQQVK